MRRAISSLAVAVATALAALGFPVDAQGQPNLPVKRVVTGEWPPLTSEAFYAPFMSYGRVADVVVSALREAGYETRVEFHTFGKAYALAKEGKADAAFPYFKTPEREKDMIFSDRLLLVDEVIFYNKKHAPELDRINTIGPLEEVLEQQQGRDFWKGARFVKGYCYHSKVETAFQRDCAKGDWRDIPTEVDAFKALLDDRNVLMLPAAQEVGERILQTWFNEEERKRIGIIYGQGWWREVYLVAPKGKVGEKFRDEFNEGLAKLHRSGQYIELRDAPRPEESVLRTVRLSDPGTFPLVVARKEKDGKETIVLPRGTKAKVVQWSHNFLTPARTTLQEQLNQMSRVMIMNGPQRGQLLWVKNVFIELD